jgi:hypothetical protein
MQEVVPGLIILNDSEIQFMQESMNGENPACFSADNT